MALTNSSRVSFQESICDFSFTSFHGVKETGNVCLSPLSISATMLLLIMGTKTRSRSQLQTALFKTESPIEELNNNFEYLLNNLLTGTRRTKDMKLTLANQLLIDKKAVTYINYRFKVTAMHTFKCLVSLENFEDPFARESINKWTEIHTGGKIKNFIPKGFLTDQTYMVLLNAIFFKGPWKTMFKKSRTKLRKFWINKKNSKRVQMMYLKEKLKAAEDEFLNCRVVEIPYRGKQFSMIVLLPNEKDGLQKLEKRLSLEEYKRVIKSLRKRQTELMLPKFKIETRVNIKTLLRSVGVSEIFNPFGADFTQMIHPWNQNGPLYISSAMHEAAIEIDENGSKAMALTSLFLALRAANRNLLRFTVDHPFLFLVRDVETDTILFIGRCVDPDIKQE